jgi:hypothetical protein
VTARLIERGTSWTLEQWLLITVTTLTELLGARARGDAMRVGISRANWSTTSSATLIVYLKILWGVRLISQHQLWGHVWYWTASSDICSSLAQVRLTVGINLAIIIQNTSILWSNKNSEMLQFNNGMIGLPYQLMHQLGSQIEKRSARMSWHSNNQLISLVYAQEPFCSYTIHWRRCYENSKPNVSHD